MSFKVKFFISIFLDKGKRRTSTSLKKECYLPFVPVENMKIKMNHKKHYIEDVVYEMERDIFIVELRNDTTLTLGISNTTVEELTEEYLEDGWKRIIPLSPEEKITNLKIESAVSQIEFARKHAGANVRIKKMSEVIASCEITESANITRIFDEARVSHNQRTLILKEIESMNTAHTAVNDHMTFAELLEAVKKTKKRVTGNVFVDKVSELIIDFGLELKENVHQVFYFAEISPEQGELIMERIEEMRKKED